MGATTKATLAVVLALAMGAVAQARAGALDVGGCPDGRVCFWKQADYNGDRQTEGTNHEEQNLTLGAYDRSAKNRFANRWVAIKEVSGTTLECIGPGGEDPDLPGAADYFRVKSPSDPC